MGPFQSHCGGLRVIFYIHSQGGDMDLSNVKLMMRHIGSQRRIIANVSNKIGMNHTSDYINDVVLMEQVTQSLDC
jgi:hypothetical protein